MIRDVHPGSGSWFFYPSQIQGPKRSRIRIRNTAYSCPRRAGTSRWYYVRTGMRCKIDDWISQSIKDTRMHAEFKRERNILLIFPKRKWDLVSINRWIITGDPWWGAEVSQTPVSSRGRCSEDYLHPHGVLHNGESAIAQVLIVFKITRGQLPYLR
jgi:hypothetical protein